LFLIHQDRLFRKRKAERGPPRCSCLTKARRSPERIGDRTFGIDPAVTIQTRQTIGTYNRDGDKKGGHLPLFFLAFLFRAYFGDVNLLAGVCGSSLSLAYRFFQLL
jgi:hypothetical protein